MEQRHIVVAAHGHCFDGLVSATMFSHLRRSINRDALRFSYKSCGYSPKMQTVPARWLRGDENAIVDFRYAPVSSLTWYFDHHITAFSSQQQQKEALARSKRFFFDPTYSSCTKLIRDVGASRFGVRFDRFEELIRWADKVDSATFDSPQEAIDRSEPLMQLAAVVEQCGNGELYQQLALQLLERDATDVAQDSYVQERYLPLAQAHEQTKRRIAEALCEHDAVSFADLHAAPLTASGKFVAYALAPDCVYSLSLIRMKQHFKISVGYNPWSNVPRRHDIAAMCQRRGGGGHPMVGAVNLPLDQLAEAQKVAQEFIAELNG